MKTSVCSTFSCSRDERCHDKAVCLHFPAAIEPFSHLPLLMLLCFLLPNFLLCLFVLALLLAYIHPTHTSHQPLEHCMKHHTVALQPASACSSRERAGRALQGYSQLLLLLLLVTRWTCSAVYCCSSICSVGRVGVTTLV